MRWRMVRRVAAAVVVGLVPVAAGALGIARAAGEVYTPRGGGAPPTPAGTAAAPPHDPAKPTAVVVLSQEGANAADVLAPYEVLAHTGAFNLYTVAARRQPVPLTGGLDLVPDLTFGQLDDRLPAGPEVIVVPQLHDAGEPSAAPIVQWLQRQRAQGDPLLVSVCVGAEVLASAGVLDGRPATSHWLGLIGLRRNYPAVRWQDGVRYVDDGDVITTAGVLSGVDGALRVVERMVGQPAAEQAARAVHWPAYSPGGAAPIQRARPAPPDVVGLLSAAYRWDRPSMGVLLTEGVGETELAAAFRPYTELSYLARPVAVTSGGQPVRSRHGLTFVPRADLATAAPRLDRLVVPGADAARRAEARGLSLPERLTPVYLHQQESGFAFDAALRDIARTRDVATARWVAKTLQYPATDPRLDGPAWPWALTLRPVLLLGAAVAAALGVRFLRRRQEVMRGLAALRGRALRRLVRHYLEMVLAMVAGMVVLGRAEAMLLDPFGWAGLRAQPEIHTLVMATNMTVAMVAWMWLRGHGWAATAEMAVAMYASFLVLFPPLWLGVLSPMGLMVLGHVLMLLAMAALMLGRSDEYTAHRRAGWLGRPAAGAEHDQGRRGGEDATAQPP
jgi:putative intracellular protease/amidase